MRILTSDEIERLASSRGAKRIAVENFLSTLDAHIGYIGNRANTYQDAEAYRWSDATVRAIIEGIRLAFS